MSKLDNLLEAIQAFVNESNKPWQEKMEDVKRAAANDDDIGTAVSEFLAWFE